MLRALLRWAQQTNSIRFIYLVDLLHGPTCWQMAPADWLAQRCLISPTAPELVISGIVKNRPYQGHSELAQPLSEFRYLRNGAFVLSCNHQSGSCADSNRMGIRTFSC